MTEKIGDPSVLQIECVHEPFPDAKGHVFGRMCLRFGDDVLGDFDNPACVLNVTAGHMEDALENLAGHEEPGLFALTDEALWRRLDAALYGDDERTIEQIVADARRYRRFDFLTNGGESFDHSRSFFVAGGQEVRVLFKRHDQPLTGKRVDRSAFVETLRAWLRWFEAERVRANGASW